MGKLMQFLGTIIVCFLSLSMGVMFTWPSSTLMLFKSENTTLHRPMSEAESALLGSISSISGLISCPLAGMFLDRIGRKYCSIISSSMSVICWAMIAFSTRVEVVLSAIFISGLSTAAFLVVPVYVSEFCQESIRGAMTSGCMVFTGIGMLISYLMGGLLSYWNMAYVSLVMSIVSVALLFLLRESPVFLMKIGREKEATESVAFYRRCKPDSKEVLQEIDNIRRALDVAPDSEDTLEPEEEKLNKEKEEKNSKNEKLSPWQFFRKSKSTRRAFYVTLVLMTTAIFQGYVVVQVYAQPVFEQAVPEMSATLASVLFAVVGVIAGFIAAYLTELAGRRPLVIHSSFWAAVCCVLCGTQIHLQWGPSWLAPLFIYVFCVLYTFGAGTVPFVLMAEVFLPEVKSYLNMILIEWLCVCNFFILVIFDPLTTSIGLGPVFYLFSITCVLTSVFGFFFVPETKGLPVDEIQDLFLPKKSRNKV